MLTFVCFKWKGKDPKRVFLPEYVNALYRALADNYDKPFRFVCITDDPTGLIVESMPLPDMVDIPSPHGDMFPSCYRRLWLFSAEAAKVLPGQVACIDVDAVICGNVTQLFDRDEDCVMWHEPSSKRFKYSGGLWMIRTGTRTHVWNDFDPHKSPKLTAEAGLVGSDQGWLSYCLDGEAYWSRKDGVYRTRDIKPGCVPLVLQTPSHTKPWTGSFKTQFPQYYQQWARYYNPVPPPKLEEPTEMARYKLLKTCTLGRKGEVVEISPHRLQALRDNGIVAEAYREPEVRKVVEPEVKKVVEPAVKKSKVRKRRASKSAN